MSTNNHKDFNQFLQALFSDVLKELPNISSTDDLINSQYESLKKLAIQNKELTTKLAQAEANIKFVDEALFVANKRVSDLFNAREEALIKNRQLNAALHAANQHNAELTEALSVAHDEISQLKHLREESEDEDATYVYYFGGSTPTPEDINRILNAGIENERIRREAPVEMDARSFYEQNVSNVQEPDASEPVVTKGQIDVNEVNTVKLLNDVADLKAVVAELVAIVKGGK